MTNKIVCIHIGARAHYLLPKSLVAKNKLECLITDTWVSSKLVRSILSKIPVRIIKSFADRYSAEISSSVVRSFSWHFLFVELSLRLKFKNDWSRILERNIKFQQLALALFKKQAPDSAVLSISYTSLHILRVAKEQNRKTILFQIDPGYKEEEIVADIVEQYGSVYTTNWKRSSETYWKEWREECDLAEVIMVNSEWSKIGLMEQGVEKEKIKIIPLPFEIKQKHKDFKKSYPKSFSAEQPLKCLFLGTLTLRKGIHIVLETARELLDYPVEFILVGPNELDPGLLSLKNVQYRGVAPRNETDAYYQNSDVFLFPTLSDGFGLTQLEAMAWGLPVIASKFCGDVVLDTVNGILLNDCSAEALSAALINLIENPYLLNSMSSNCLKRVEQFNLANFAEEMLLLS